jgi:hypothetical protein
MAQTSDIIASPEANEVVLAVAEYYRSEGRHMDAIICAVRKRLHLPLLKLAFKRKLLIRYVSIVEGIPEPTTKVGTWPADLIRAKQREGHHCPLDVFMRAGGCGGAVSLITLLEYGKEPLFAITFEIQ